MTIEPHHLDLEPQVRTTGPATTPAAIALPGSSGLSLTDATDEFQRRMIAREVERADGNWAAAGRALGLDRSNLHRIARRLGMK